MTHAHDAGHAAGRRQSRILPGVLILVWVAVAAVGMQRGLEYYLLPFAERPLSPDYEILKPSGTLGLVYGIVGASCITLGVVGYSLRKRVRVLARAGRLGTWLNVHIFLCTVGPLLVLLHTSLKVGGIVSIAFWSMTIVTVSGIFGRYVYVRIPKTVHGQFADLRALRQERDELLGSLRTTLGVHLGEVERVVAASVRPPRGLLHALVTAMKADFVRSRTRARISRILGRSGLAARSREQVLGVVERSIQLEQELVVMVPFQRLFRHWHLLHLPLAITMFIIVAVHVTVAVLFGYAWLS